MADAKTGSSYSLEGIADRRTVRMPNTGFSTIPAQRHLISKIQDGSCRNRSTYTVKHVFFACIKFSRISRVEKNRKIKYPRKFSLPKGLVNTSRTLGKCQIKMQRNFYIPKSRNYDAANVMFYSNLGLETDRNSIPEANHMF